MSFVYQFAPHCKFPQTSLPSAVTSSPTGIPKVFNGLSAHVLVTKENLVGILLILYSPLNSDPLGSLI